MTVAGRWPSRKARICEAMCSRGRPARETTSLVTARPSVPWQMAQAEASCRGRSCAYAGMATQASVIDKSRNIEPPWRGRKLTPGPEKGKALRDRGGLFLEDELHLLVLADVDRHLAAVLQAAEQQ